METYAMTAELSPQGLSDALQLACLTAAGLATAAWLLGERHTEVFDQDRR